MTSRATRLSVARYGTVSDLPAPYGPLFSEAERESFFLSLDWFRNFERTVVGPEQAVVVYGAETGARSDASAQGALVAWRYRRSEGPVRLTRLEALGNYYTSYFAPIVSAGADSAGVVDALVGAICRDRADWDELYIQPLDPTAPAFQHLRRALRRRGLIVQSYACFGNWYLDVGGRSYAEYLRGLPGMLRKNIPYATRRLERTGTVRHELITGKERLAEALSDYERVYRATWKQPEPYPAFVPGLASFAADRGWLRLGLTYLDGEPVAAQLWLVANDVASIYKMCYDERVAKYSVGTILTARLLEHVIDVDGVREVDYLSGDDAYKRQWMSDRRERWGLRAFNPLSARGLVQGVKYVGGRLGKAALARVRASRDRGRHLADTGSADA
jgi:CelD/BcsL family acetyltransferase involved in cellulose biosynthesis